MNFLSFCLNHKYAHRVNANNNNNSNKNNNNLRPWSLDVSSASMYTVGIGYGLYSSPLPPSADSTVRQVVYCLPFGTVVAKVVR